MTQEFNITSEKFKHSVDYVFECNLSCEQGDRLIAALESNGICAELEKQDKDNPTLCRIAEICLHSPDPWEIDMTKEIAAGIFDNDRLAAAASAEGGESTQEERAYDRWLRELRERWEAKQRQAPDESEEQ